LKPLDVLTSFHLKDETRLAIASGVEVLHDVGSFLLSPLTKFGILQKSAKPSNFSNYSCQEIINTFGFTNEALHLKLVLQKIPKILSLVNVSYQDDVTPSSYVEGDV
jgi:hypothetical protein